MFKLLVIAAIGFSLWALQSMNEPLTAEQTARYNAAYQQIEEQAARREAAELDAAQERSQRHAALVSKYRERN